MLSRPIILATIGLILSCYAVYVEHRQAEIEAAEAAGETLEEFQSLCDIQSIGASCSATFALPEGRMLSYFGIVPKGSALDVPNAVLGALFYTYIILNETLVQLPLGLTFFATCMAMSSSIFLACKLIILKKLCLLCWTTHVLNFLLIVHYGGRLISGDKGKVKAKSG
mmetsp:Transcript_5401/g.11764  ORF Transcript_5401/g.11764 Transcript_5401/m.11764 type:complete len:168 (-) Transcript_5401:249-752(-)